MANTEPKEKYIYKSELELMQESYSNCYSKPSKKLVKEAFGEDEWEDDYREDYNGDSEVFDGDMEGFEEEHSEIDPSDMSEICKDVCSYIKEKLVEFGYSADQFNEVVAGLGECECDEQDSFGESDAAADYDEENPDLYSEDEETEDDLEDSSDDMFEPGV